MRRWMLFLVLYLAGITAARAQTTISGRVTDAANNPLSGVSVRVKETANGTVTDAGGAFSLSGSANSVLVFTAVGYTTRELAAGTGPLTVVLEVAQQGLQEVVVTGYTTQNRRSVAGSVARIVAEEVSFQPVGSFDKALQGQVPGLLAQSQSGQPGAAAAVTIRGRGSINGNNTPLYIVDGVQVNAADFASINPMDIESYNVLKDASSASIYGSRGANGVIVISTKRGAVGRTRINYNVQYGRSELPPSGLELMNSAQKIDYELNYNRPEGKNPFEWTPEEADSLSKIDNQLDEILFRKGAMKQHHLSASGGTDRMRFYISGSLFDQEGIVRTTGLKRYTGRVNFENSFGDFRIGLNTTFGYSRLTGTRENDQYIGSPLNAIRWFNPYVTLYDAAGNYQDDFLQGQPNPLRELNENANASDQLKGVGSAFIEFNVPWVKGLRARTLWGGDFTEDETMSYLDRTTNQGQQATGGRGSLSRSFNRNFRYTGTTSLAYQRVFGRHDLSVAVFNEIIQSKFENFNFTGFGLVGPFRNEAGITPGTPTNNYIPTVGGTGSGSGLLSYFADAVYGFNRKYFLNAGIRRDGSSRLSQDRRWANFAQAGFSWIISEEKFLSGTRGWLSDLKYKVSYGSVGSQGISDFGSLGLLGPAFYNGVGGLQLNSLPRDLTWERKLMFNTGLEFTLLRGRVGGTLEYYNNITNDLFLSRQLSRTSGFESVNTNLGRLQNKGVEASIEGDVVRSAHFTWTLSANYTRNNNKVLELGEQDQQITGIYITKEGARNRSLYLVRYAGVDPKNGDALYLTKDGEPTNVYDPSDAVIVGTIDPPHFGGFGTEFNYRGVELSALFTYAFGNKVYNNERFNVEYPAYWYSRLTTNLLREWQRVDQVTDIPSPFNDFHGETTRFVEDGDYLRLRNVTLAYNLPRALLGRYRISGLRVFVQGQNLRVWHNFQGFDPEITTGILTGAQYPQLRTFTAGINVGL